MEAREKKKLSTSHRQAVIRLIEKKERKKWAAYKRLAFISLLNVSQQTAYVKNRFTGEGGRFISDILEMSESLNLKGYIVTVDLENHSIL